MTNKATVKMGGTVVHHEVNGANPYLNSKGRLDTGGDIRIGDQSVVSTNELKSYLEAGQRWDTGMGYKMVRSHEMYYHQMVDYIDKALKEKHSYSESVYRMYFENCHPFIFSGVDSPGEVVELPKIEEVLDLPYPCIHIEVSDKFITVPSPDADAEVYICSFFAVETAPREYRFLSNMMIPDPTKPGEYCSAVMEVMKHKNLEAWLAYNGILKEFLTRLTRERMGLEEVSKTPRKMGSGSTAKVFRGAPIVHVAPKKVVSQVKPVCEIRTIDWTHRWEVRGHWRVKEGLGKDRDGNYVVKGWTWVTHHVRGPEHAPVVKKTYVVE